MANSQPNATYTAILNSAATIAIISASLYYVGYLYLLGFYRAFGIPIDSLNLSFQVIAIQSRIVFIPTIFIFLYIYALSKTGWDIPFVPGVTTIRWIKSALLYIQEYFPDDIKFINKIVYSRSFAIFITLLLIIIASFIIPLIGENIASGKIEIFQNKTTDAVIWPLENPMPKVMVYSTEPLPSIKPDIIDNSTKNSTFVYRDFMLITATDKSFYLFSKYNLTYQVPIEKVLIVYLQ